MGILDATCVVNCDMEIESSSYGIENTESFTMTDNTSITISSTGQGIQNTGDTFTVSKDAVLNITSTSSYLIFCSNNACIFTISGKVTLNGIGGASEGIRISSGTFIITDTAILNITVRVTGITVYGTLIVFGEVIIAVDRNQSDNPNGNAFGIYIDSDVTVNGTITITLSGRYQYGIYQTWTANLTGTGTITVNGEPYDF